MTRRKELAILTILSAIGLGDVAFSAYKDPCLLTFIGLGIVLIGAITFSVASAILMAKD